MTHLGWLKFSRRRHTSLLVIPPISHSSSFQQSFRHLTSESAHRCQQISRISTGTRFSLPCALVETLARSLDSGPFPIRKKAGTHRSVEYFVYNHSNINIHIYIYTYIYIYIHTYIIYNYIYTDIYSM